LSAAALADAPQLLMLVRNGSAVRCLLLLLRHVLLRVQAQVRTLLLLPPVLLLLLPPVLLLLLLLHPPRHRKTTRR